jgi:hypothetical protein
MDEDAKKIIEKEYSILASQPELLLPENKDTALSVLFQALQEDFDSFFKSGELRSVTPTNPIVREVYFGNIDLSQFTGEDIDGTTDGLRATLETWENSRAEYAEE